MNGVIVNVVAVLAGTFVGLLSGGIIPKRMRSTAVAAIRDVQQGLEVKRWLLM